MGRVSRSIEQGLSAHITQRGNNQMHVFRSDADHEVLLLLLKRAALRYPVAIHAYALMSNHFHLLVTPNGAESLARMMQFIDGVYATYFNRTYHRTGSPWTGRYRPLPLTDEIYWLTCLRYIELNPVRAGMVDRPEDYRWSSYCAHAFGQAPSWLAPHPVYDALGGSTDERCKNYRQLAESALTNEQLIASRCSLVERRNNFPTIELVSGRT